MLLVQSTEVISKCFEIVTLNAAWAMGMCDYSVRRVQEEPGTETEEALLRACEKEGHGQLWTLPGKTGHCCTI